ncbi:MAG: SpoIIE family protein phosphatase [Victivallales bacterium]|nr:SpoIIE family protein phosphatase [Victivallales bacterium]
MSAGILSLLIPMLIILFYYNYRVSQDLLMKNAAENARNLTLATRNRIDQIFLGAEKVTNTFAAMVAESGFDEKQMHKLHKVFIGANKEIFGTCMAFEPGVVKNRDKGFAPYYFRDDGAKLGYKDLMESYDYFTWEWYSRPKALGRPVWTEPYFDEGGGDVLMTTYSVPLLKKDSDSPAGIATADLSLDFLEEIMSSIRFFDSGYGFLVSEKGVFVTHPNKSLVMSENIADLAKKMNSKELNELSVSMDERREQLVRHTSLLNGEEGWLYHTPLKFAPWTLAVFFSHDELVADLNAASRDMVFIVVPGVILILLVVVLISGRIIAPLGKLTSAVSKIGTGDIQTELPAVRARDEIGKLTEAFGRMQQDLKRYISDIKDATIAKEKIESELRVAHEIQMSIVPRIFPPFPDIEQFSIFAALKSAKAVGGDIFDFFLIDDRHLCFSVGDVSGKGVPASLMMAITRTLLRTQASGQTEPGIITSRINDILSRDNDAMMFVTFFLGVLDIMTGELYFTNSGHNPPLLKRKGENAVWLDERHGLPLGIDGETEYLSDRMILKAEDLLVLYTDGVTEASNQAQELFNEARLLDLIESCHTNDPQKVTHKICDAVEDFEKGAEQADDITVLVLRFNSDSTASDST